MIHRRHARGLFAAARRWSCRECEGENYPAAWVTVKKYAPGNMLAHEGEHVREQLGTGICKECRIQGRVVELLKPYGVLPVFQGDPRGAVVKLKVPSGRCDDWGNNGLCVPA